MSLEILDNIGKTYTQKIIDDINKNYRELFEKKYPKYFENQYSKACSLITVTEKDEIKSIGMSKVDDLLNDNYGNFLGGLMAGGSFTVKNTGQQIQGISISNMTTTDTNLPQTKGMGIQIGKGVTPATRQDFNIETPFTAGQESLIKTTGEGGWNSGLGTVTGSAVITATGGSGGAISESVFRVSWRFANTSSTSIWSRDNISPVVNFINGQTINVNYAFLLS